ncbi:MAG: hypothetical protein AMS27_02365 [Bacteroides sp. SM23_62_1]|nr:MAG: hypothetical protein AMS27_02365 [Bacteroides sp. SM23_62_1]
MQKPILKFLNFPLVRIIVGILICIAVPLLLNRFALKPLFNALGIEETLNRCLRAVLTLLILMPYLYWLFYNKLEKREITELGKKGLVKDLLAGLLLSAGTISLILLFLAIFGFFKIESFSPQISLIPLFIMMISLVFVEELLFRGIIYRIIENSLGTNLSLVISGLLFGLFHITNESMTIQSFFAVVIGGMMVGIMFTFAKRLWLPVFFHFGWNFTQVLYGVTLSGTDEYKVDALFKSNLSGPDLLTGGKFGPENSIATIILTFVLFLVFYWLSYKKNKIVRASFQKHDL